MAITVEKYQGDFSDLGTLRIEGFEPHSLAEDLARCDVYVGRVAGEPKSLFVLTRADSPFALYFLSQAPYVVYFANTGGPELRVAMLAKIKAAVQERGFSMFYAMNAGEASDEAWAKAFAPAGRARRLGSMFAFDVGV